MGFLATIAATFIGSFLAFLTLMVLDDKIAQLRKRLGI